jgi:hypothetical protein
MLLINTVISVSNPGRARDFFAKPPDRPGAQSASYSVDIGVISGVKAAGS